MRSLNAIYCSYYKLQVDEVAVISNCMKVKSIVWLMVLCAEISGLFGIKMVNGVCVLLLVETRAQPSC